VQVGRCIGVSKDNAGRRFTTTTCLTAGLTANRFTICRPTFPVEPSTTAEYGCMADCSGFMAMYALEGKTTLGRQRTAEC
jgi:hypothetical protein